MKVFLTDRDSSVVAAIARIFLDVIGVDRDGSVRAVIDAEASALLITHLGESRKLKQSVALRAGELFACEAFIDAASMVAGGTFKFKH